MKRHKIATSFLAFLSFNSIEYIYAQNEINNKPNVLLIVADDMGFSDLGCYGNPTIQTPTLDSLANNGVRFSQFYNGARSCPARASLLTGLYAHQAGCGHMMSDLGTDGYRGDINNKCVTIAEVLQNNGYSTYMTGKWHITKFYNSKDSKQNWPLQRGFDNFYGTIVGGGNYFDPASLCRQNKYISPFDDPNYNPNTYYYTNAIGDNASKFIKNHVDSEKDKPFFMYMAFTAPHFPLHALPEDIEKYKGKFDIGWDKLREMKLQKMNHIGLFDKKLTYIQRDSTVNSWNDEKNKSWEAHNMEVYAAMVTCMDDNIRKVIDVLEESGQLNNTLILFLSDNGGCAEGYGRQSNRGPIKLPKGCDYSTLPSEDITMDTWGRSHSSFPYKVRSGKAIWHGVGQKSGADTTFIAYGKKWANFSNVPFKEYKHWTHEGGIATPFICFWPSKITKKGQITDQRGQLPDIMATIIEVTKSTYPKEKNNISILPYEGKSLLNSAITGETTERTLYWEHEGNCAISKGYWKLVRKSDCSWGNKKPLGEWELYNIKDDRTENNNLSIKYSQLVEELSKDWEIWAKRCNILPFPNTK